MQTVLKGRSQGNNHFLMNSLIDTNYRVTKHVMISQGVMGLN